jgi:nucleoside-diphosphate-sugar epimerase
MPASAGIVVVTGVSSFVGAHLARTFQAQGFNVVGTLGQSLERYAGVRLGRIEAVRDRGVELRRVDLRDAPSVAELVRSTKPDLWVNHAGWATDYGSLDYDLAAGFDANVLAMSHVYEALNGSGCRGVLVTGSSAEYSDSLQADREEDACWPSTPYGLAKLAETVRARQLALRFGVPTRVARVYIPFGPMDAPGKLLSAVLDGLLRGESIDLSPCTQQRDFIHVDELAKAYVLMARDCGRAELFDIFNLCSGAATPLDELLLQVCELLGAPRDLLRFGAKGMRPGEAPVSYGSPEKAASVLGWRAPPLREMVENFVKERLRSLRRD